MEELYTLLEKILEAKALTRLVCSRSKDRSVEKVSGRIIELRGLRTLQLETFTSDGKARQKNLPENTALPVRRRVSLHRTAGVSALLLPACAGLSPDQSVYHRR